MHDPQLDDSAPTKLGAELVELAETLKGLGVILAELREIHASLAGTVRVMEQVAITAASISARLNA